MSASGVIYVLDNEAPASPEYHRRGQPGYLPYSIGSNGALQAEVSGAVAIDPSQSNPIYAISESKGKWLYVANQGDNTDPNNAQSGISAYTINSPFQLTPIANGGATSGTGAGPQCMLEDPSDQYIYTANFNDSSVTGRSIDQNSGVLRNLPGAANRSYPLTGPAAWCMVTGRTS